MFFIDLCAVIVALALVAFTYFKWSFRYWKSKGIPYVEPGIPFGNMENPFARTLSVGALMKTFYDEYKAKGCKHLGLYNLTSPVYMPIAPEHVKNIMQSDFQHFVERGAYYNEKDDPLSAHLFNLGGTKWRNLRTKLTPTFTSGKMRMMFEALLQCSRQMKDAMDEFCEKNQPVDIKDVVASFTTDVIGSCAFGVNCNSFKDPNAEFRVYGKKIFEPLSKIKVFNQILGNTTFKIGHLLRIALLPKDSTRFFFNVIDEAVKFREANNVSRSDALQLLIDIKNTKSNASSDGKSLTMQEVAAQALIFFLAGFETSSATTTFVLFELARNLDIQERARREINSVLKKYNGKITYDAINEMKYLQQVIDESLRLYPPLTFLNRRCVKNYKMPNSDLEIEKGTLVFIPVLGLQCDEEYFPDPERYDPERFSEENKPNIPPFTYIPFGEGPRICLGLRFGLMQVKLGLITILKDYIFTLNAKTEVPLKINAYTIILANDGSIWLDAKKIEH